MTQLELLNLLSSREPEAKIRALAMMAYNPAIGRVLAEGGVTRFSDIMLDAVPGLYGEIGRERFESWHQGVCAQIMSGLRTNRGKNLSYGQAQKPLNVFLKVYVAWAKHPTIELADALLPLLHCPLDSVVMTFISREFPEAYRGQVMVLREDLITRIQERFNGSVNAPVTRSIARAVVGQEFSLVAINKEIYLAWQGLLRSLYPSAPVRLDTIWAIERPPRRKASAATMD